MEATTQRMYEVKGEIFERPILSNHPYGYKLLNVESPYDFMVSLEDEKTKLHESQLNKALKDYTDTFEKEKWTIDPKIVYEKMPVLLNVGVPGGDPWSFARAEVLKISGMDVTLIKVDCGGTVKVPYDRFAIQLFGMPVDMARIPKLGIPCALAHVRPSKSTTWPSREYAMDFSGKTSQIITFMDFYPEMMSYEVILEVDEVNVTMRYFHLGLALPYEPNQIRPAGPIKSYPLPDFTHWVGMKAYVFCVGVFSENIKGNEVFKCILQMEPEKVDTILNMINEEMSKMTDEDKVSNKKYFKKLPGTPCLAPWGSDGEYFRATIQKEVEQGQFEVRFVDYGEIETVQGSQVYPLPPALLEFNEGATICIMSDFLTSEFHDMDKLTEMMKDKDLYAVIDCCDPKLFGRELVVTMFQPVDFKGPDKSFTEILGLKEKLPCLEEVLQLMNPIPSGWKSVFMTPELPLESSSDTTLIKDNGSLFVQLKETEERAERICKELNEYYSFGGCPDGDAYYEIFQNSDKTGAYVAAKGPTDYDGLCRAIVLEDRGKEACVRYIDFGVSNTLPITDLYPLHQYFAKDKLCAFEVKVIV